jgi:predicted nuclease of restriction endonuclease-like (RecB) superfamily
MADRRRRRDTASLTLTALVEAIRNADTFIAARVGMAVNAGLTLRNWIIGFYIYEYEQHGTDRARYGENLLDVLSAKLSKAGIQGTAARTLRLYRQFCIMYPNIRQTLIANSEWQFPEKGIWQTLSAKSQKESNNAIVGTVSAQLKSPGTKLFERLSFSHFAELVSIEDPLKRAFYEIECMRGNWSVRELKRQIGSLYYERSGLSKDKKQLAELVRKGAETAEPKLAIRDPYVFEFLGIKAKEVMAESDLEDALLDKLHDFLLELGHGFCFEARQKRILIGKKPGFVDLVFYHRVLKCHVLIELKVEEFTHEHLGQLNTYVSWYRKNMMSDGDNLPVGILLCTQKEHALVEYALAGMDNRLFVSKYQLELPKKAEMERFLEEQMKDIGYGG